jgi:hypothetical protein
MSNVQKRARTAPAAATMTDYADGTDRKILSSTSQQFRASTSHFRCQLSVLSSLLKRSALNFFSHAFPQPKSKQPPPML